MKKKKIIYAYFCGERQLIVDYLYNHNQWAWATIIDFDWKSFERKNNFESNTIFDIIKTGSAEEQNTL